MWSRAQACDHWLPGGGGELYSGCPAGLWWPEKLVGRTDPGKEETSVVTSGESAGSGKG